MNEADKMRVLGRYIAIYWRGDYAGQERPFQVTKLTVAHAYGFELNVDGDLQPVLTATSASAQCGLSPRCLFLLYAHQHRLVQ